MSLCAIKDVTLESKVYCSFQVYLLTPMRVTDWNCIMLFMISNGPESEYESDDTQPNFYGHALKAAS